MIFESFDKKKIFVHEWLDVENPKGLVQIVHGMAEHGGRYEPFARYLNENGYLVVADDHRAHGYTDPDTLGYSDCKNIFFDTVKDEGALTDYYKAKYPTLKYVIFGFSYGSFLTQCYLAKYGDKVDGAVIAGSNHKKDFEVYLGALVAGMGKKKKAGKFIEKQSFGSYAKKFEDGEWISADAAINAAYRADPFSGFTCSNKFYADFFKGLKSLYTKKYKAGLKKDLPVLIVSGAQDPVGNMGKGVKKLYRFYQKAGMTNVQMTLFEGCRHEFINERQGLESRRKLLLQFLDSVQSGERA